MAEYEVLREIFNQCSGNQMRDIYVEEAEIEDIDSYMDTYRVGKDITEEVYQHEDGTISYDMNVDGLRQRITFQPI
ncbi:MAG: hypothetical protein PUD81_00530 [Eggerthellales bacterium]|nr:hypothetical protein [Eggerthellales bacterium]